MKKILILCIALIILLGALYTLFVFFTRQSGTVDNPPIGTNFPTSVSTSTNNGQQGTNLTLPVRTSVGGTVFVRDFRKDQFVEATPDNTYILSDTASQHTATFLIAYFANDGGITVALREEPLRDARLLAEEALIRHLGVTREQLCGLAIHVGTTIDVNEFYAGEELGISSCPGSRPL